MAKRIAKELIAGFTELAGDLETILKPGYRVRDKHGEIKLMAVADGWCLVRRPGCEPFAKNIKEWLTLAGITGQLTGGVTLGGGTEG